MLMYYRSTGQCTTQQIANPKWLNKKLGNCTSNQADPSAGVWNRRLPPACRGAKRPGQCRVAAGGGGAAGAERWAGCGRDEEAGAEEPLGRLVGRRPARVASRRGRRRWLRGGWASGSPVHGCVCVVRIFF